MCVTAVEKTKPRANRALAVKPQLEMPMQSAAMALVRAEVVQQKGVQTRGVKLL